MKKKYKRKKKSNKIKVIIIILVIITIVVYFIRYLNGIVMPVVSKTSELNGIIKAEESIDEAVIEAIKSLNVSSQDFYSKSVGNGGKINSISADTILINQTCAEISSSINEKLGDTDENSIALPFGIITGIDFLSTVGPKVFIVKVVQKGASKVQYETMFTSAGINQVNFQIWINITAVVSIVTPLSDNEVVISRKAPLVNTVITGDVPNGLFMPYSIDTNTNSSLKTK